MLAEHPEKIQDDRSVVKAMVAQRKQSSLLGANVVSIPIPIRPHTGQESVWDYPRPPLLEHTKKRIEIVFAGMGIVDAPEGFRVLGSVDEVDSQII